MGSRMLGRDIMQSSKQIFAIYRLRQQSVIHRASAFTVQSRLNARHMSVFNEFSKRVKGEVQSNPELQKSIKELKEKASEFKGMTEDLKTRTKQTTEHLYKHADAVRMEAEAKAKQVSAAMKDKISAATEQAKELSENLKLRSDGSSEKARGNASDNVKSDNSSVPGAEKIEGVGSTSSQESSTTNETLFSKFGKRISTASSSAAVVLKSLKETKIMDMTKKGYDIVKEELTSTPSRRRRMQNAASASAYKERSSATSVVPVAVKQTHWGKSGKNLKRSSKHSKFIV